MGTGVLVLADGTHWQGDLIGARARVSGELCFNTSMWGYQEIHTDPSYRGQIIVHTAPYVGNYGLSSKEVESAHPQVSAVVMRGYTPYYSRSSATMDIDAYLSKHALTGLCGVDTRALVMHLANKKTMNAVIGSSKEPLEALRNHLKAQPLIQDLELVSLVSTSSVREAGKAGWPCVGVLDFGVKNAILEQLIARGIRYRLYPWNTPSQEMTQVDAYLLSNGPGNPEQLPVSVLDTIRALINTQKPILGICMGLQLIARAYGISTYKLPYGHRGSNHPVRRLVQDLNAVNGQSASAIDEPMCVMTSQNHGFAVSRKEVEAHPDLVLTHEHVHDQTVAGLRVRDTAVFAVQYHPEASPGPHDSYYVFDAFVKGIKADHKAYHHE